MSTPPVRDVYSVSRLCLEANLVLEGGLPPLWMEGELSNVKRAPSGHWYFTVKDEVSQIACTMWKSKTFRARVVPREGLRVQVYGRASIYSARGSFQFNVDYLEDAGEGALRRRFEELKAALTAEGLFDSAIKRALPKMPRCIGVITSPTGAAIRDVLHILGRRFPSIPVVVYPVTVQGASAAAEIARALAIASERQDADVLILARGGGSLEDLWSFNEEIVARAIRACQIPVVTGVGHETDTTIADFAADLRAATPSGAAEQVAPDQAEWRRTLASHQLRLASVLRRLVKGHRDRLTYLERRLTQSHPRHRLRDRTQRLDELEVRLQQAWQRSHASRSARLQWVAARLVQAHPGRQLVLHTQRLDQTTGRLERAIRHHLDRKLSRFRSVARTLQAVSPLATVERGYAIVTRTDGSVLRNADTLTIGDTVEARLGHGRIRATITEKLD